MYLEFHTDTGTSACSETSVCASCLNSIDEEEFIQALNQDWHIECFRCSACDVALSSWYFEKDGLLFCKEDYWTKYGESCQDCGQVCSLTMNNTETVIKCKEMTQRQTYI